MDGLLVNCSEVFRYKKLLRDKIRT